MSQCLPEADSKFAAIHSDIAEAEPQTSATLPSRARTHVAGSSINASCALSRRATGDALYRRALESIVTAARKLAVATTFCALFAILPHWR